MVLQKLAMNVKGYIGKEVKEAIVKRNAYQRVVNNYLIKKMENRVD